MLFVPASGGSSGVIPKRYKALGQGGKNAASVTKAATMYLMDHSELIRLRRENEQLRMGREIIQTVGLPCQGNRIKYGFIREQQKTYPVAVLFRVMEVSTSAFYTWLKTPDDRGESKAKSSA